jgi:hypothetical protein
MKFKLGFDLKFFPALREVVEDPDLKRRREAIERKLDQMKVARVRTLGAIDCKKPDAQA